MLRASLRGLSHAATLTSTNSGRGLKLTAPSPQDGTLQRIFHSFSRQQYLSGSGHSAAFKAYATLPKPAPSSSYTIPPAQVRAFLNRTLQFTPPHAANTTSSCTSRIAQSGMAASRGSSLAYTACAASIAAFSVTRARSYSLATCDAPSLDVIPQAFLPDTEPQKKSELPRSPLVKWVKLLLVVMSLWTSEMYNFYIAIINVIFVGLTSCPSERSLEEWVWRYRGDSQNENDAINTFKQLVSYIELCDFKVFMVAKVTSLGEEMVLIGALGDWWLIHTNKSKVTSGIDQVVSRARRKMAEGIRESGDRLQRITSKFESYIPGRWSRSKEE